MKKIILIMVVLGTTILDIYAQNNAYLNGKIIDQKSGEALSGVSVYFPDLKTGSITDSIGNYKIFNLPKIKLLVEVAYLGYQQIVQQIDLSVTTKKDFELKEAVTETGEIVITGLSSAVEQNHTPSPISVITPTQLKQSSATNIIDALTTIPGISQVTTGAGISKPIIRGLGYNRVVVINDGIRQEGQQWGDEHGLEIDEYGVNRVEILKGPASLTYGSDAIAGVINLLPPPTLPEGVIKGNLLMNYQTNNGLIGTSLEMGGNQKGFIWDFRFSQKYAHSYTNKYDGYVFNSGFRENNIGGTIGVNKSWGYSHLSFSSYRFQPGIIEGERDSTTGVFTKPIAINDSITDEAIAENSDFKSYQTSVPYQKIHHHKIVSSNNIYLRNGSLKATLGWQQNKRQEYEEISNPKEYGLYLYMNTLNYDFRYHYPSQKNREFSLGVNGMYQNSKNKGIEFLIPDYSLFDFGIFTTIRKSWEKWTLSGGVRYDIRTESGKNLWLDENEERIFTPDTHSDHLFSDFHLNFQGISGSIGTTYRINKVLYTKLNLSKGFRAPNIAEISANGVHEGSAQYLLGSHILKPENNYQIDYILGGNSKHITFEADLFYNRINNYIFLEKLQNSLGTDSLTAGYQTFEYTQGNAHLFGGEITIDIHPHPLDWLHFENSFSYVQSVQDNQPDSMKYLPFTPTPKLHSELRADIKKLGNNLANAYFKIGVDKYFRQNHFYAAYNTETATSGYTLLNAGIGTDILAKDKTILSIYFNADNLTNFAYQSHLSRLKYLDVNNATGRTGVYNMGRNFSFKVVLPIGVK
ncbi:MAG: TonB-dependent receptor [Chitinophagales bacterium]|nr:TonB-dependent receptor [Chitinophagales bacterium]